ncbi:hypothetical protein [Streptomyces sp. NPDC093598]|uniref:hypothetical protein n=1 Tax=Streptomyces sp. NPDC093598 TaxID=3366046 RepID=UPI00382329B1
MTDMTRPPGGHTPTTPDARGESALGTGHGTTAPGTDRGAARDTEAARGGTTHGIETDRGATHVTDAGRGVTHGTDADRAAAHGTDVPGTGRHGTEAPRGDSYGTGPDKTGSAKNRSHLLAHDESDKLGAQLQHAVAGFVDGPRAAVEEADHVLEEIAARFTEAVTQRRRTLRHSWQSVEGGEGKSVSSADTEQLRLALKDYRELAERLLHV